MFSLVISFAEKKITHTSTIYRKLSERKMRQEKHKLGLFLRRWKVMKEKKKKVDVFVVDICENLRFKLTDAIYELSAFNFAVAQWHFIRTRFMIDFIIQLFPSTTMNPRHHVQISFLCFFVSSLISIRHQPTQQQQQTLLKWRPSETVAGFDSETAVVLNSNFSQWLIELKFKSKVLQRNFSFRFERGVFLLLSLWFSHDLCRFWQSTNWWKFNYVKHSWWCNREWSRKVK